METLLSESELSEITGVAVKYSPTAYSKWLETCLVVAA